LKVERLEWIARTRARSSLAFLGGVLLALVLGAASFALLRAEPPRSIIETLAKGIIALDPSGKPASFEAATSWPALAGDEFVACWRTSRRHRGSRWWSGSPRRSGGQTEDGSPFRLSMSSGLPS
jgi:hypothetical protein